MRQYATCRCLGVAQGGGAARYRRVSEGELDVAFRSRILRLSFQRVHGHGIADLRRDSDPADHSPHTGSDPLLLGLSNADAVAAWIEGNGGAPTPKLIRERQFYYQCGIMMVAMEDYFSQHEEGLLSDEQFARGSATFRERLKEPGLRDYWLKQRGGFVKAAPRYSAFIDGLCAGEAAVGR